MSRHNPTRFIIAIALLVSPGLTPIPQQGLAGTGITIQLPYPGTKIRNGIMAEVDGRWVDGWGYRPVNVTLRTQKARADRTIRVVVMPNSYSKHHIPYAITSRIEIPQGSNSASKTIYVPQQEQWNWLRIEFFEGRRKLKDLSMENSAGWNVQYRRGGDGLPTLLMVDGDAPKIADRAAFISTLQADRRKGSGDTFKLPDARKFGFMIQSYRQNTDYDHDAGRVSDLESLELLDKAPTLEIIPPSQLPNQQIGLSGIDLILIPLEDLQELARSDAERFTALKRHIQSGGNLIVYGNQQLILDQTASILGMLGGGWREPDQDTYRPALYQWQEVMDGASYGGYGARRKRPAIDFSKLPFFRVGQLGMGQVTVIRSEDPFKSDVAYWQWVLRTIGNDRLAWMTRHGVSLIQNNSDYWDFMIPGFGRAPVKSFLATISLFIIVIGPVNYYLLKRAKRLYLLPVTVGGAAMVTTVAMLCYAVVSDGISTRVRLRSFTHLDQAENVAATHCRHAYLAAIAPSGGLLFPTQTCVYPLVAFQGNKRRREVQNDRVEVRQLVSGYIRSRSTTQFLTTEVQETEAGLAIDQTQGELKATNRLGTAITHLWIWDGQGQLYMAHDTAHGAACRLHPVDVASARKELKQLLLAHRPQTPPGLDKGIDRNMFGMLGFRASRSSIPVKFRTGLLEKSIAATTECFAQPVPNSYLAIAKQRPSFLSLGTAAEEEAGIHFVRGVWEKP